MSEKDEEMVDLDDEVIELTDDEGNIYHFRYLDVTEYQGKKYVLMVTMEPDENADEGDVVVFHLDEETEELESVENDDLAQEVYDAYCAEEPDEDELN